MGAVCHTINPRLFAPQIAYIANHAGDRVIFTDLTFVPLLEEIAGDLAGVEAFVVMTDEDHMPKTTLPNVHCYERLVHGHSADYDWPELDENAASSLCYSSGTTGDPKGVLYSHRSTLLHAFTCGLPDAFGLSARDAAMPVVPMFHVNAWGIPYVSPLVGCKLVMPGADLDGASLQELIEQEGVTFSAGVPTVWLGLLQYLEDSGKSIETLERAIIGGSATPRSMTQIFAEKHGVDVLHAWGMTEMSPIGTVNQPKYHMGNEPPEAVYDRQVKQGRAVFGVEMKIVDDDDKELPHDGVSFGELKVRGPWVCSSYYEGDKASVEGRHQVGRRVDLLDRAREHRRRSRRRRRGRDNRRRAPQVGRASAAAGRPPRGRAPDQGGDDLLFRRQGRQVVDSRRRGVRRRAAAHRHRQAPQDQAPRRLQGPQAADGVRGVYSAFASRVAWRPAMRPEVKAQPMWCPWPLSISPP
jgi:acyl-CoA synthetase (AMP-forming)/AMP-acid ligase II